MIVLLAANLGTSFSRQAEVHEATSPAAIQYTVATASPYITQKQLQTGLTGYGQQGWRLVLVYPTGNGNLFVFSKP